jgi:hypothetical protein
LAGKIQPNRAQIENELGVLLLERGDPPDAARTLELFASVAEAADPRLAAIAQLNLARAHLQFGQLAPAADAADRALASFRALDDPAGSVIVPGINFNWDGQSPYPGVPRNLWSMRCTSVQYFPSSGLYQFSAQVDDGVRLFVDGNAVINAWSNHAGTTQVGTANLGAIAGLLGTGAALLSYNDEAVRAQMAQAQITADPGHAGFWTSWFVTYQTLANAWFLVLIVTLAILIVGILLVLASRIRTGEPSRQSLAGKACV